MNIKNSSWVLALAHGHQRDSLRRRMRLVPWASKARCLLSPPSPPAKRAGREGEGLKRLVVVTRLDAAWALGYSGTIAGGDQVEHMDSLDARDQRLRLDEDQWVPWGAPARYRSEAMAWRFARLEEERLAKRRHHQAGLASGRLDSPGFAWIRLGSDVFHQFFASLRMGACALPSWEGRQSRMLFGQKEAGQSFVFRRLPPPSAVFRRIFFTYLFWPWSAWCLGTANLGDGFWIGEHRPKSECIAFFGVFFSAGCLRTGTATRNPELRGTRALLLWGAGRLCCEVGMGFFLGVGRGWVAAPGDGRAPLQRGVCARPPCTRVFAHGHQKGWAGFGIAGGRVSTTLILLCSSRMTCLI